MKFRQSLAIVCILNLMTPYVQASAISDQLNTQLAADSTLLSGWMTSNLKYVIPFNSTAGNVVPSQLKILGFEVGVEGVVSGTKMDVDGLHALNTTLVNTQSIDMFSRLPFPMVLGHAKIGLPFGFDAGIRLGGIPKTDENHGDQKGSIKNKIIGLDLRKKIIEEGVAKPFGLTVGLSYTHADGSLDITNTYNSITETVSGQQVSVANGQTVEHADWKTNSVGLQVLLDKQILFITPYIGASLNHNSGDINNSITTTGTPVVAGVLDPNDPLSAIGSSTDRPSKWDTRALLGIEFSLLPFVKLGLGGEYGGTKNVAGSLGLRIQFR